MEPLAPIPTPPAQRWREFRIQALPVLTFIGILSCVVLLWREFVVPTNVIGEVEATRVHIISAVPGTIKEIKVQRFQRVKAGDEIALVSTMDAEALQASFRAIEADLKVELARMQLDIERNIQNYEIQRLDYMKERIDLDLARVDAIIYGREVARQEELLTNGPALVRRTEYDYWVRLAATSRTNVIELEKYLAEKEKTMPKLVPATQAAEAILESIKAQEEELRLTEQPISLKSPIDGMVSALNFFAGQKIVPNLPIAVVSAVQATRIVGYVRKPYGMIPKPGDTVQIRRQSPKRETGQGTVLDVAVQLELISPTLVPPITGSLPTELGLPFAVSIPAELALIPGEAVDLLLLRR